MFDWGAAAQLVTVAISLYGVRKIYLEMSLTSRNRIREEYKFAKEFLAELRGESRLDPFLREKGCQAITGDSRAIPEHVEYLLSLQAPSQALSQYSPGKKYLEHSDDAQSVHGFAFKKWYRKVWVRALLKGWYCTVTIFFGAASLWIPPLANAMFQDKHRRFIFALTSFPVSACCTFFFLYLLSRVASAELLMTQIRSGSQQGKGKGRRTRLKRNAEFAG
ncbi:hypothetical protein [Paraburkholderia antibiotica]|uniref:Uncharacterized protein n=1 Tax=Paraburkholderia antibiotica TaxID=2728839 RepID=A0A7Y0A0G5_9BURK|nr:hypothetical protein [Paraburkholderia antibiotica]NML34199.1 hypothetical protein [Paraburkholderia antibiotica]